MRVQWTDPAAANLWAIAEYFAVDSPVAALAIYDEIERQVAELADHPHIGRPGRVKGSRELVVNRTPYIVAYRVDRGAVVILRVIHGAQRWPRKLEGGNPG